VLDTVTRADKLIERERLTGAVEASLHFGHGGARTVLTRQRVPYPFHVTRSFYLDQARPDLATLYLQSAAGVSIAATVSRSRSLPGQTAPHM
jgi:hypothetical protein